MKIAFVTNTCWNVFNFRKGLVDFFIDRGDEVISLAPADEYSSEIEKWGVRHIHTMLDKTGSNPVKDLKYLNKVRSVMRAEKPDVALCFTIKSNIYGSLAGMMSNVPTICNVSGLGTVFLVEGWQGRLALKLYRFAFQHSNSIFFQNKDDKALFLSYVKVNEEKIGLLPGSGVNLDRFEYSEPTFEKSSSFVMIARILEEKGVREFVEAAKIVKDRNNSASFTLIGNLDESHVRSISRSELEDWVKCGLINYLPHSNQIESVIRSHEVVVLPSYREGTPRTLLEGAAMGRPLIATDVAGCREVVEDGVNGFLCQPKDPKSLADKINLYLSLNEEEKRSLSFKSRQLVESKFDENLVIGKYTETIAQIVDKT